MATSFLVSKSNFQSSPSRICLTCSLEEEESNKCLVAFISAPSRARLTISSEYGIEGCLSGIDFVPEDDIVQYRCHKLPQKARLRYKGSEKNRLVGSSHPIEDCFQIWLIEAEASRGIGAEIFPLLAIRSILTTFSFPCFPRSKTKHRS